LVKESYDGVLWSLSKKINPGSTNTGTWSSQLGPLAIKLTYPRGCVTPKQIANLKETIEDDLDLLDGYDELDTESQDKVKEALANGHIDDADWTGVSAASIFHLRSF